MESGDLSTEVTPTQQGRKGSGWSPSLGAQGLEVTAEWGGMLWMQGQGWETQENSSAGASGVSNMRQPFFMGGQCLALTWPLGVDPEVSLDRQLSQ